MFNLTLQNRYRLEDEIGSGGMGAVYRAHDTLLDRAIAIKLLNDPALGPDSRERLLREARAAARLNHPNIVGIYDVGGAAEEDGVPFIVMEMVDGRSLYDQPPASLAETITITAQICAALDHAHTHGVVHRDLKLENILIARDGTVKLTDFGLARSVASRLSLEGTITGTVFYLAPELALGQPFDGRADLYALGVLLYELTTHRLPFDADDPLAVISQHLHAPVLPPRAHNPEIPPALDSLIVQLLSKRPEDRPASARDVKAALDSLAVDSDETGLRGNGDLSLLDRIVRGRMVGREREFGEASALWRKALSGEAHVLLISGEPGIGKTRLTRELIALAEVSGAAAFVGECYAEGGAPYAPVAQIIQSAASVSNLQSLISPLAFADLLTLAPALHTRFPGAPRNSALDPQAEQQRIFESVVEWCAALTSRAPALLVVDDAHWADGGTLSLLRHLARRARARKMRLLVVLTYREVELSEANTLNDALADLNRDRLAARLKLARLSREQTSTLLAVMFEEEITAEFLDGVYRETEGNPFFVEEVCKALIEEGQLVYAEGQWRRPDMGQLQVPQSIRVAIQARVGKLTETAQEILRLAAAFGREFEFGLLQRASDAGEDTLIESLEQAVRAQLVVEVKEGGRGGLEKFIFAHALIPAALRESVSGLRRHRLHRRVAAALETLRPDDLETLAYQYAEAGDEERARAYYARAGARAQKLFANRDAIKYYTEALSLYPENDPARFDVLMARSAVYDVIADRDAQRKDAEALLALAKELGDDARLFDALLAITDVDVETDEFRAREPAEQALAIARKLDDKVREAHALRRVGWLDLLRQEYVLSQKTLERASTQFREENRPAEAAACLHTLSLAYARASQIDPARKAVEESIALSRAIGDRRQEAIGLRRLGIMYDIEANIGESIKYTQMALALHREMGDRAQELNALANLGGSFAQTGQWGEAKNYAEQTFQLAEAIDSSEGLAKAVNELVFFYYRPVGLYGPALDFVNNLLAQDRASRDENYYWKLRIVQTSMLAALGQYQRVLDFINTAQPSFLKFGKAFESNYLTFLAVLLAEVGQFESAQETLRRAADYVTDQNVAHEHSNVPATAGYVHFLEGHSLRGPAQQTAREKALARSLEAYNLLESARGEGLEVFRGAVLGIIVWAKLELGQVQEALADSTRAVAMLEAYPLLWTRQPEVILYGHVRALRLNGNDAQADEYLKRSHERVMLVHDSLPDTDLRRSWLENVKFNQMLLEEWSHRAK